MKFKFLIKDSTLSQLIKIYNKMMMVGQELHSFLSKDTVSMLNINMNSLMVH